MEIYLIYCKVTGKSYVGQTKQPLAERFARHLKDANAGKNMAIQKVIKKHGFKNFIIFPIERCGSQLELDAAERYWIEHYDSLAPFGYNVALGGNGSHSMSEATREKIAAQKRGKARSEETRSKISKAQIGKLRSEQHKTNISNALQGRKLSQQHIERVRNSQSGEKANNAKLTWDVVREIRRRYAAERISQRALAAIYGVNQQTICNLLSMKSWRFFAPTLD